MAKMLEVALWPRFLGCFFPAALARLWMEGERRREGERREEGKRGRGREGEEEEGGYHSPHKFQNASTLKDTLRDLTV